jgi:hypothetical protein
MYHSGGDALLLLLPLGLGLGRREPERWPTRELAVAGTGTNGAVGSVGLKPHEPSQLGSMGPAPVAEDEAVAVGSAKYGMSVMVSAHGVAYAGVHAGLGRALLPWALVQ